MAKEAERLLADTGWLAEPLRLAAAEGGETPADEVTGDDDALPDFLTENDEDAGDAVEDDEAALIAAE